MQRSATFASSWGTSLKLMTLLALVVVGFVLYKVPRPATFAIVAGLLAISALFMVRNLELAGSQLVIHRPGWAKRYDLSALQDVKVAPDAMQGSLRIFGIGGLFSYVGLFRNSRLGWYRAYATDQRRAVVLRFPDTTVVVTPHDPDAFANAVRAVQRTGIPQS